ncbi:DNA-binding protein (plasmid) [Citricoccus sp. SGAir0253]|uniref:helix-turn-helix domain-containing protein n=1 Tax=Citricoccus sp. SGAir0253 TaxID=2567881 RepID=UPI0010CD4764|nr:helix-turn-helix domain-containing protein [Citricoccus sp. SGAir0253]QCU79575.1 DNA-binding protein [Citricoccus sp. SGAir0253]
MSDDTADQLTDYPELLTLEEVAGLLGTDLAGALTLTGNRSLRALEIGASIRRYRREDVAEFLAQRST